ncbi:MAG TPA: glycosyltransferase family 39 protein [Polyangiaceae bacterium LLY-WYZ-15_(1-7)]|nr:glycosyltransferase family 39 protein [Polyangiaceae bacterium LLY-WYZ-15_(1-7)]HJL09411.1 glycosyltransferase family 39 protein [Polyangiaceae bacterium LLY-WYZ-15_(1-7)]HJL21939.1 glycosyltransferase family 39 protein [Polyangiaceae bacterium LLY-WYZ-15_(1-7)]HJL44687.1 glycosyltransferase family 39 protein [Polyangiaceae bacterium LLY-WYZ-15_(1-7)]
MAAAALMGLVVLGGLVGADHLLRHGVAARWEAQLGEEDEGAEWVEVTRTVEHRAQFPNERRALSRYVQGWDFEALGIPPDLFPFRATIRTRLHLPRPGYQLRVDALGPARVRVDGAPHDPRANLAAGDHDLDIVWSGDFERRAQHLRLELCRGARCDPVPASWTTPPHPWTRGRVALWALGLPLALGLAALLFWALGGGLARRRRTFGALAFAAVLALGLGLRLVDYDVMPDFRENGDELFATWNGWQLLESGETRGWSLWAPVYGSRVQHSRLEYFGMDWSIIQPYFEHPPATHLLVGAAAHLGGAEHFAHAKLKHTRLVPILLAAPCLILMFLIGRRLDPVGPGPWLACLLYATLPTIVLQTRVIKEEALLGPLSLGAVYAFLRWKEGGGTKALVATGILAGLATLAKVTGFAFVPAVVMLVLAERKWREGVLVGVIGVATSALLLLYGAVIDWDTFVFATERQGTRPVHFNIFLRWFDVTLINHSVIGRGWVLFLWLGTVASHVQRSWARSALVAAPLVFYLAAITIGTGNWTFGWYAVPLYPWLCLGCGRFLADCWQKPDLLKGTLFSVVLVMYTLNFAVDPADMKNPEHWSMLRYVISGIVFLLLAPWALVQIWPERFFRRLARGAFAFGLAVVVVLSARFVAGYETNYETYKDFDRDVYFDR